MIKKGEIYYDPQYTYPAGNTEDKLLVVLNKFHIPDQPVIVIPAASNKTNTKYNLGCNHSSWIFFLKSGEDFFKNDTKLQLFCVNHPIRWDVFQKKNLKPQANLKPQTIDRIMKCLKDLKQDIDEDLQQYIF